MTRDEGLSTIRDLVADSLGLEPEEVQPGSRLIEELGADSLDLIDMLFVMEKQFDVKLREGDLGFLSKLGKADAEELANGRLDPGDVARLTPYLPGLTKLDAADVTPARLFSLVQVDTLWLMVESQLAGR